MHHGVQMFQLIQISLNLIFLHCRLHIFQMEKVPLFLKYIGFPSVSLMGSEYQGNKNYVDFISSKFH